LIGVSRDTPSLNKRRNRKGRILRTGKRQKKGGKYAYKYSTGDPRFLYAWRLSAAGKAPAGKREAISLREKEEDIQHKEPLPNSAPHSLRHTFCPEWPTPV